MNAPALTISVVSVCFNAVRTLGDTLASVACQSYQGVDHLIIDGASTDGTVEILKGWEQGFIRWVSEPDCGIYDAMNKGISMATGDVIGTLNADDVYASDSILAQVAEVFADPTVDACYADLVYVDQHDPSRIVRYWKSRAYEDGLFERGWMPAHPTFFVRRSVYERFGGFDLNFPRQADFELTMRFLAVHKIKTVYVPNVWVKMRMGGVSNNSIRGVMKGNLEAWRACRKNGLDVGMFFIPRKILSRIPQFFMRPK